MPTGTGLTASGLPLAMMSIWFACSAGIRPAVQGLSDVVMGLAGAAAGALSGIAMEGGGYPLVATFAAIASTPLLMMMARGTRATR